MDNIGKDREAKKIGKRPTYKDLQKKTASSTYHPGWYRIVYLPLICLAAPSTYQGCILYLPLFPWIASSTYHPA